MTMRSRVRVADWDEIGVVSSSVARAAADSLRVDVDALNEEISTWYRSVAKERRADHGVFVNAWTKYRDSIYKAVDDSKRMFNPELASSIVDRMNREQANVRNWRARFSQVSGLRSQTVLSELPPVPKEGSSVWLYVAVGLGSVVLVGGVLTWLLAPRLIAGAGAGMAAGALGRR